MGYALQFDGSQNYVTLGTMGGFGAALASGFYASFNIVTTNTTQQGFVLGTYNPYMEIQMNSTATGSNSSGCIQFNAYDTSSNQLEAGCNSPTIKFNNGGWHTVTVVANFSAQTVSITIDGVAQVITYGVQSALTAWANFEGATFLGARDQSGNYNSGYACTLTNVSLGVTPSTLYGIYPMTEGSGTTTADISGNGNTGTLTGSPLPMWVAGYPIARFNNSGLRPHAFSPGLAR